MRLVASMTAGFVMVASSGLAGLCFCHDEIAEAELSSDAHACCHDAEEAPVEEQHVGPTVGQTCASGCCSPSSLLEQAEPERRAATRAPLPAVVPHVFATQLSAPHPSVTPAIAFERAPPPPPGHERRSALLQRWTC